jgi:hypothetical protein
MKHVIVISSDRDCRIELTHHDSDQSTWIVRRWKKFLWFKQRISSDWFNDEHQATVFANKLKEEHNLHVRT